MNRICFQAIVHARQKAKQELSTLRETVRIRAEQRAREKRNAMNRTRFKAWISKYALTDGVYEIEAEEGFNYMTISNVNVEMQNFFGDEWHRSREAAVAHAEKMRERKLVSLHEQIERLKSLRFS